MNIDITVQVAAAENAVENGVILTAEMIEAITETLNDKVDVILDHNVDNDDDVIVQFHVLSHALIISGVFDGRPSYDRKLPTYSPIYGACDEPEKCRPNGYHPSPKYYKIWAAWGLLEFCEGWDFDNYYPIAIGEDGEEYEATKWELADKYRCRDGKYYDYEGNLLAV